MKRESYNKHFDSGKPILRQYTADLQRLGDTLNLNTILSIIESYYKVCLNSLTPMNLNARRQWMNL